MLHPVPNSKRRARLLRVVVLQRKLLRALCALPKDGVVDQDWLCKVWATMPEEWVRRFWENDKGDRAASIIALAAAPDADKKRVLALMVEQFQFARLYDTPAKVRLTDHDWSPPVFAAVKNLLVSFFDPLFYQKEGYPNADGTLFHKEQFINPQPKICPYTDNVIQDPKLDHFLPKDRFPLLSCHPDNLIPCSTDSNSGSHKGKRVPLDLKAADQAEKWFHPRWRSARETYRLTFTSALGASQPRVQFVAVSAGDQTRLDNFEKLFGLSEFWGRTLDDEVQNVAGDVQGWLSDDGIRPTEDNVKHYILKRARQERKRIGKDCLAVAKSYFYEHIAQTPTLLAQIVRTCSVGA